MSFMQNYDYDSYSELLKLYIAFPNSADTNWNLAVYYDSIGQTASAVSFYLRAAERTNNITLKYECLLKSALCFERQGSRNFTVRGLLQHAVSIQPKRPEAYFLLSRHYERQTYDGHWNDGYMIASIGDQVSDTSYTENLRTQVEYPYGNYGLLFEKAVCSWWCGLCDESRDTFTDLILNYPLDNLHYTTVFNNLKFLQSPIAQFDPFTIYIGNQYDDLKFKFSNSDTITRNYSEAFQDMFVLTMLNGKQNGSYLEIGSGHPVYGNNTYLLEKQFGWRGVSIDYNSDAANQFNQTRGLCCLNLDATQINYTELIQNNYAPNNYIDYLQIDCDPPEISYQVLLNIDFNVIKFGVITFEHDYYTDSTKLIQTMADQVLSSHGYILVGRNISPDGVKNYEDWWVHPEYVDSQIIEQFKNQQDFNKIQNSKNLFLTNG